MKFGSRGLGLFIGIVLFAFLLFLELLPFIGGPRAPNAELTPQMSFGAQFAALPPWVKIWMHFQDLIVGASLIFVLWRKEAQVYGLGIIANHVFLFAAMPFVPVAKLTLGLASLSHFFWIVPLVVLIRAWPSLDKATGYGTWVTLAICQIIFSLIFDIPDGVQFLASLF